MAERTRRVSGSWKGDAAALEEALRTTLRGPVGFDAGSRGLYATDGSNYRQVPIGVVWPRSATDVERTFEVCRRFGAPVLARGGGTSLAGQCCNVAVTLDFSRFMDRVLELDPLHARARVEPGCILDDLRSRALKHGLTFAPDPATHTHCTLGGMIGNNSCGVHTVMAGRTAENVSELELLLYDGTRMRVGRTPEPELERIVGGGGRRAEIYARLRDLRDRYAEAIRKGFPEIPRRVSGYNLDELLPEKGFNVARALVGSEGSCASWLEATVELVPWPRAQVLLVLGFEDAYRAADQVPAVLEAGPIGLEGLDRRLIEDERKKGLNTDDLAMLPEGGGWLLCEFGADDPAEALRRAEAAREGVPGIAGSALFSDRASQEKLWGIREAGLGATARVPAQGDTWPGWEDSAVPPHRMGDYMRELRGLLASYGYEGAFYGHFGDGCLHTRIDFDLKSRAGLDDYHAFAEEAAGLCVRYGGSLSGEHGDGQSRAELLPRMFGEELCRAFDEFKAVWDPDGRMNPGKGPSRPYPILSNLRLGNDYRPWQPETEFRYPEDDFSFARAPVRCVGVGLCRRTSGGVMCPSYMVTRDEKHSTRGRARLLFEMLQREEIADGWRSREVKEALDLCLACKGCKKECPVNVDMATYKAEFMAQHYRRRLRPVQAYSMGLIYWWARLASRVPRAANLLFHAHGLSGLAKRAGGLAPEREMPRFAERSFRSDFGTEPKGSGREVILWPDTFNNFFLPGTARAAAAVLEASGCRIRLPPRILCCGRPLYDFGMLGLARRLLRQTLDVLSEDIRAGTPVVGVEPSCVATFRDELPNLFPHDEDARRLERQTFTLAEFLRKHTGFEPKGTLRGRALVQRHCHHSSILGFGDDHALLEATGLEPELLDSGCCGMAGAFGFERGEKYAVSQAAAERALLPAVRSAPEAWLVGDGFSCREQVLQNTGRRPLHLAEVLQRDLSGPSQA